MVGGVKDVSRGIGDAVAPFVVYLIYTEVAPAL